MFMGGFWDNVPAEEKMSYDTFMKKAPKKVRESFNEDESYEPEELPLCEFARFRSPAFGPAGAATRADDKAYKDVDVDDNWESLVSVSPKLVWMAYRKDIDELYCRNSYGWMVWNY